MCTVFDGDHFSDLGSSTKHPYSELLCMKNGYSHADGCISMFLCDGCTSLFNEPCMKSCYRHYTLYAVKACAVSRAVTTICNASTSAATVSSSPVCFHAERVSVLSGTCPFCFVCCFCLIRWLRCSCGILTYQSSCEVGVTGFQALLEYTCFAPDAVEGASEASKTRVFQVTSVCLLNDQICVIYSGFF